MCGRFTLSLDSAELQEAFASFHFPASIGPRYNISPSQPILAIPNDGKNQADFFTWGLIPGWAKAPASGLINARAETLAEKPSFRGSYRHKRCLILANGFYEWKAESGQNAKTPYFIHLKDHQPFAMAGLWDEWHSPEGSLIKSCAIITTLPNSLMTNLHARMPVILSPQDYATWLSPNEQHPTNLSHLLRAYPAEEMTAYPVSAQVNSPKNDRPELLAAL
jgi:putative SOS response-associated peptidase YedK